MDVLDALARLRAADFQDRRGRTKSVVFHPGLPESEVEAFETDLGVRLPGDYRRLVQACRAIEGLTLAIDFAPAEPVWANDVFPFGVPFASDDAGNFWVVDAINPAEAEATLFFDCHDPPITLFHGTAMAAFLLDLLAFEQGDETTALTHVHADDLFQVWGTDPNLISREAALASADLDLRLFAEELGDEFALCDLRAAPVGMGFAWGRFGLDSRRERFGMKRLFAVAPPVRKPGLIARLLGRR